MYLKLYASIYVSICIFITYKLPKVMNEKVLVKMLLFQQLKNVWNFHWVRTVWKFRMFQITTWTKILKNKAVIFRQQFSFKVTKRKPFCHVTFLMPMFSRGWVIKIKLKWNNASYFGSFPINQWHHRHVIGKNCGETDDATDKRIYNKLNKITKLSYF